MLDLATRSALAASLAARRVQKMPGRLFADFTREVPVLLDKDGTELKSDALPLFVLATDGDATDGNRLRMHWNTQRADAGAMHILVNHDVETPNAELGVGLWRDLGSADLPTGGRGLLARADFDMGDEFAARIAAKSRRGYARTVSLGWIPGALTLRGDLDPMDGDYAPPEEDACGQRVEGYVMGSEEDPNEPIEASLTPIPSDFRAAAVGRMATGERTVAALARGERVSGADLGGVLLALRDRPGVRSFVRSAAHDELATNEGRALLRSLLAEELRTPEGRALLRSLLVEPSRSLSLDSLFGAKPCAP